MIDHQGASKRRAIINIRLAKMQNCVEALKRESVDIKKLAINDQYIRIGGNGYTLVSLGENSPLCGFGTHSVVTTDGIKKHIQGVVSGKYHAKAIKATRVERSVQSYLIKKAILSDKSLLKSLNIDRPSRNCDILFALDEVQVGDKNHKPSTRCDMIGVVINRDKAFPVLIEIKYDRLLTELRAQLNSMANEYIESQDHFCNLLSASVGLKIEHLESAREMKKIIIWPALDNPDHAQADYGDLHKSNIAVLEFNRFNKMPAEGLSFAPINADVIWE